MARKFPPYPKKAHRSGNARISIDAQSYYIGPFGSEQSYAEYRRLMAEWAAGSLRPAKTTGSTTVAAVLAAYLGHVETTYSQKQQDRVARALEIVRELYGHTKADAFRLAALEAVRSQMVKAGWARTYCNSLTGCIKLAWRWAGQRRMVTAECVADLELLPNIREGAPGARETDEVEPVEWEDVRKALRYMRPQVRAMVLLQWFAGMRTQEVLLMRPRDINRRRDPWIYEPSQHKNKWRGQRREVYLGRVAQRILRRYLAGRAPEAFCFSPREAMAGVAGGGRRDLRHGYRNTSYAQAVRRACEAAGVPPFAPYQLRHSAATRIGEEYGPETARLVLGQKSLTSTRRYMQDRGGKAAEAMRRSG